MEHTSMHHGLLQNLYDMNTYEVENKRNIVRLKLK